MLLSRSPFQSLGLCLESFGGKGEASVSAPPLAFEPLEARVAPATYSTIMDLESSINPSELGQGFTLTAKLTAFSGLSLFPAPAGAPIEFFADQTSLGTASTDSEGIASIPVFFLAAGVHELRAEFAGGVATGPLGPDTYLASEATLTQTVTSPDIATSTTLESSVNPSEFGQSITLTATVVRTVDSLPVPSFGSVQFFNGPLLLGSAATNPNGEASIAVDSLPVGSTVVRAVFAGGSPFLSPDFYLGSEDSLPQTVTAPVVPPPPPPPTSPPSPPASTPPDLAGATAEGTEFGPVATARLIDPDGIIRFEIQPYGPEFIGGVRVAVGDVNNDGTSDLITAPGPGGAPLVRVFDGQNGNPLGEFMSYDPGFLGGVFVAAADVNGDGAAEIVTSPDEGGGPRVRVVSGTNGSNVVADFFGIDDPNFRGGARIALGDVNGDGVADLAVGAGFLGGPRVALFDGTTLGTTRTKLVNDFFAFEDTLRNGVFVTIGDLNGDIYGDLIFGAGPGGAPRVLTLGGADLLAGKFEPVGSFFAGPEASREGVRVGLYPQALELYLAAVDIATRTASAYTVSGVKVIDLPSNAGVAGFVGSVPYDVANFNYVPPGPPSSGGAANNIEFNHTVVESGVKGVYSGEIVTAVTQIFYDPPNAETQPRRVTVTLEIQDLVPSDTTRDPALATPEAPYFYGVTGRVTARAAGIGVGGTVEMEVRGTYRLDRFPDTFNNLRGYLEVAAVPNSDTFDGAAIFGPIANNQLTTETRTHFSSGDGNKLIWGSSSEAGQFVIGLVLTKS